MKSFRLFMLLLVSYSGIALTAEEKKPVELSVLLNRSLSPDHVPLVVAAEKGFFAAHRLDVEFVVPSSMTESLKLITNGEADIAIYSQPQLHIQVNKAQPLKRIGTLIASPLNCIVVLDSSPIRTIGDLKGRKIGYSQGSFDDVLLQVVLEKHGLSVDQVTLTHINSALISALISGSVDAVVGALRHFDLNRLDMLSQPGRVFYLEEEGIPAYDEMVFIAHLNRLDEPHLLNFMRAVEFGVQYSINHPDEAWAVVIKRYPQLDDELNRRAWRDTLPRFALRPAALDRGRYRRFAQFLAQQDVINMALPVSNYAVELGSD